MKLLGQTNDGYILSATRDEVAHVMGYYSRYSDEMATLKVGDEIDVNNMYKMIHELQTTVEQMRRVNNMMDTYLKWYDRSCNHETNDSEN